jgi:hypothetical protein
MTSLPLTTAVILYFVARDRGASFGSTAALTSLVGVFPVLSFIIVYARTAYKTPWIQSLAYGWVAYLITVLCVIQVPLPAVPSFLLSVLGIIIVLSLLHREPYSIINVRPSMSQYLFQLMGVTGVVVILSELANVTGPRLIGVFTPFPIYTSVMVVSIHRYEGPSTAIRFLRGVLLGLSTFSLFSVCLATSLNVWPVNIAFVFSSLIAILAHGFCLLLAQTMWCHPASETMARGWRGLNDKIPLP